MSKKEFLDLLRQSLEGEVNNSILEQSMKFYNEYISSQSNKSEEDVIEEIGDPRLIAKTIIETENASRVDSYSYYNDRSYNKDYGGDNDSTSSSNNKKVYRLKWYHMVILVLVILFLFSFLIRVGWLILKMLSMFLVPIIIIIFLFSIIFRRR